MQLLLDLVLVSLLFLIKIGDIVLFVFSLAHRFLKFSFFKTLSLLLRLKNNLFTKVRTVRSLSFPKQIPTIHIKIPHISFPIFPKGVVLHFKSTHKKAKKTHPVKVFPRMFFTKIKYFTVGSAFSFLFIFLPLLILLFIQDLPNPKIIATGNIPQTTKIYDRNGIMLYQIYATQNRTLVQISNIPKDLQNATIAIEDKDFYKHPGFDVTAIIRSFLSNLSGKDLQGGSTLTQQLIKSTLLTPETSISRKVKEIILAFWAERMYTKQQLLEMYFNQVPYGGTAWGIEAASELYFGKNVKDLNLSESSFLAGIPRAPTIYSPFGLTPNTWKKRQKEVLERMVSLGYISRGEFNSALQDPLHFKTPQIPIHAPHFVMYVKEQLVKKYGLPVVEKGGLTVITTLDLKEQEFAQKTVTEEVDKSTYLNLSNGAAVITNPQNGDILAMVGSKDFTDPIFGNVNVATSLRQPGSSIKVVTYAAALSNGFTAATIIDDSPITYRSAGAPPYSPVNYDGRFHGRVPLRLALGNSFNIPAVKTLDKVGVDTMIQLARRMGVKNWNESNDYGLAITLGGAEVTMLDMTTVYATLANSGLRVDVNPILKITDSKNVILEQKQQNVSRTQPLFKELETIGTRVLDEGVAFIISQILSDNTARMMAFGPSSPLHIPGKTVSVKTGTTDQKRDNWTIGYTKDRLVAVWVGNNDNTPMSPQFASGITGAAPIWNKLMVNLLKDKKNQPLVQPKNIVQKPCLGRIEYFIKGTEQMANCGPSTTPFKQVYNTN